MQAMGYASQHIWCLSQARINWEGCGRKGIWCKNVGMMDAGHWLFQIGYGYGVRNADGSRILEFADGLNLVILNTVYEAGI